MEMESWTQAYGRISLMAMTTDELIGYLISDLEELLPQQERAEADAGGWWDYLTGVIERSQSVLRMLGVPEQSIPQNGDC